MYVCVCVCVCVTNGEGCVLNRISDSVEDIVYVNDCVC